MKKILITILIIIILGAAYWLLSPLWRTERVSESLPVESPSAENAETGVKSEVEAIKTGMFTGFDRAHTGSGTARIIKVGGKNYIRFEEDFTVQNGPDLYVGLGANGQYIKGSELDKLKGNVGSQNYELPESMNPDDVQEIWIWCKLFSVPFAKAVLN